MTKFKPGQSVAYGPIIMIAATKRWRHRTGVVIAVADNSCTLRDDLDGNYYSVPADEIRPIIEEE